MHQTQWCPERPLPSPVTLASQTPMRTPLRSPAQVEGSQGFLPQPEKYLERPSSTRLEARFPYHDSRAMTRSPWPLAWRPDFPGAHEGLTDLAVVSHEKPHPGAAAREPSRDSAVIAEMRAFISCMA